MIKTFVKDKKKNPEDLEKSRLLKLYNTMQKIRRFEEKVADLVVQNEIFCPCHLYSGQEAIATGVCSALRDDDWVFSNHRSHGHYIAKSGDIYKLMAELYGKKTGCSHGRGGSMHLAFPEKGLPGSSAIVAGTISLAVGAALAFSIQKTDRVAVAFFGDGATNEGVFYEALNFASLKKLPVLFICENNLYSTHMPTSSCCSNVKLFQIPRVFNIPSKRIGGNDILTVYDSAKNSIETIRAGNGPYFLECMTYRWRGHVGANYDLEKGLRNQKEFDVWMNKCPIKKFEKQLFRNKILTPEEKMGIVAKIDEEIDECLIYAKKSPYPDSAELFVADSINSEGSSCVN
jgi:pyruvate dehydrogenase E1 component alpha subunit